jgi:beta-lactam-binding protein with PASTA domain
MAGFLNFKRNVNVMNRNPDRGLLQTVGIGKNTQTVPSIIGLTQALALTAINAAGLNLGQVTLTIGIVTAQYPAAGDKANKLSPVNITLTA